MNNENHDPEEIELKNEENERKELIECLALAYGITPNDEAGYTFNYAKHTQKEIAHLFGYDNSTFGKMLHPAWNKSRSRSYKPMIALLKKQIQINELNKELLSNQKTSKKPFWILLAMMTVLFPLTIWLVSTNKGQDKGEKKKFVTTYGDFSALYRGEAGMLVAKALADESYSIVRDFHTLHPDDTLSFSEKKELIGNIQNMVRKVICNGRDQLRKQNFFAQFHKEYNVVEIIDHISPRDSLFKCLPEAFASDLNPDCAKGYALFDKKLWDVRNLFFDKKVTEEVYKRGILNVANALQNEASTEDERILNHFIQTGELIQPYSN